MRSLAILVALLAGCDFYFGGGDDEPCRDLATTGEAAPSLQLRNPQTGQCQDFGGNFPCDSRCGPCAQEDQLVEQPDWGMCFSACEGLAEDNCQLTSGCFAAYTEFPTQDRNAVFRGCWQTAPSGPISTGGCSNLAAQECSRHDNCTAHYVDNFARKDVANPTDFLFCAAETVQVCSGDDQCNPGQRCTAGEEECNPPPGCNSGQDCPAVCWGRCVGDPAPACETLQTETQCAGRADCERIYKGDDCTCTPTSCECNILTYERCETK